MSKALSNVPKWAIWAVSAGVSLVVFLILYFAMVKPTSDAAAATNSSAAGVEQSGGTPEQVQQEEMAYKKAVLQAKDARADWSINSARYMPTLPFHKTDSSTDLIDIYEFRNIQGKAGYKSIPDVWGSWLTHWYAGQARHGVDILSQFAIPSEEPNPNAVSSVKYLVFPSAGKYFKVVVMCNSFKNAMDHLKRLNDTLVGHGMPVITGVQLAGNSPFLIMTYYLQLYVIPGQLPPQTPDSRLDATGQGAGGAGGGGFGGPGGMMGGPPGFGGMGGPPGPGGFGGPPGPGGFGGPPAMGGKGPRTMGGGSGPA